MVKIIPLKMIGGGQTSKIAKKDQSKHYLCDVNNPSQLHKKTSNLKCFS